MEDVERIAAVQDIMRLKARYFRAADTKDMALMAMVLAEDCELDFAGACRDPATGGDLLPGVTEGKIGSRAEAIEKFGNGGGVITVHHGHTSEIELHGPDEAIASFSNGAGVVTVHHGHTCEIAVQGSTQASAIWAMTDHLYFSPESPVAMLTGHGHYHETYERLAGVWLIKTLRLTRLQVETTMRA